MPRPVEDPILAYTAKGEVSFQNEKKNIEIPF